MDALTVAAASGLRARIESLDLLANNLANQGSPGFKADRELFNLYRSMDAGDNDSFGSAPLIESHWTDLGQGPLRNTGNPSDLALDGRGFFVVESATGKLLTRNGQFRISPEGRLETREGHAVLSRDSAPIVLTPGKSFEVSPAGTVTQDGEVRVEMQIADVESPGALRRQAGTYFQLADTSVALQHAKAAAVHQGTVEESNGAAAESAVRLVSVLRQFEMLQRAIQIGGEMSRRADDIGRVSG